MSENQDHYYQDYGGYQSFPYQGSPPNYYNRFNFKSYDIIVSSHHQKQIEMAQTCRQQTAPHHHARLAASQSRLSQLPSDDPDRVISQTGSRSPIPEKITDWSTLDFSGMMISNLTNAVFKYDFLTCIHLNNNNLQTIPPDICKLRKLVTLNLSANKITVLPLEIGFLVSLKTLNLFDNLLSYLPAEVGQLYQLEFLGLEGNPMTEPIASMIIKDGTTAVIEYLRDICPVGAAPIDREWVMFDEEPQTPNLSDTLTVMCYNILSERYATAQTYSYTPTWALAWDYRKDLLLQEILTCNADIVCLQEVEAGQYEDFFLQQLSQLAEYDGVFYPKSRARTMGEHERHQVDGCATFFKRSKYILILCRFKVLDSKLVEFQQVAMQRPDFRKSDDFFNRVVPKDNIAVLALLEQKDNGAKVIVVNVHLHWDPAYSDVKLIQAALLLEELESNLIKWNRQFQFTEKPTTDIKKISSIVPILICGDLNSLPDSGVFSLLSSGHLAADHADLKAFDYRPLTDGGLTHKLELQSAYQNISDMEFTNFTPTFKGIIDYIWYTKATMTPTGLLSHVDKEYVQKSVGFPNPHNPSDHIPLLVSFRKQNLTNDNRQVFFK